MLGWRPQDTAPPPPAAFPGHTVSVTVTLPPPERVSDGPHPWAVLAAAVPMQPAKCSCGCLWSPQGWPAWCGAGICVTAARPGPQLPIWRLCLGKHGQGLGLCPARRTLPSGGVPTGWGCPHRMGEWRGSAGRDPFSPNSSILCAVWPRASCPPLWASASSSVTWGVRKLLPLGAWGQRVRECCGPGASSCRC